MTGVFYISEQQLCVNEQQQQQQKRATLRYFVECKGCRFSFPCSIYFYHKSHSIFPVILKTITFLLLRKNKCMGKFVGVNSVLKGDILWRRIWNRMGSPVETFQSDKNTETLTAFQICYLLNRRQTYIFYSFWISLNLFTVFINKFVFWLIPILIICDFLTQSK